MKRIFAVFLAAMAVSLAACGGTKITEMSLEPELTISKGGDYQLEVTYKTAKEADDAAIAEMAAKYELEWTSSDETVALVDQTGLVTPIDVGEAEIRVSVKGKDLSAACKVTVENPVTGIRVPKQLNLTVGDEKKKIEASLTPKDAAGYELQYESSDEKIATVDQNGNVTPVAEGECVIRTTAVAAAVKDPAVDATAEESASSAASEKVDLAKAEKPEDKKVLALGETRVTVKAKEAGTVKNAEKKNSSDKASASASSASNSSSAVSNGASSSGETASAVTPAAPAPAPAPAPVNPEPAPAPAPAPETSNPGMVSGDGAGVGMDGNLIIEGGGISEGNGGDAEYDD